MPIVRRIKKKGVKAARRCDHHNEGLVAACRNLKRNWWVQELEGIAMTTKQTTPEENSKYAQPCQDHKQRNVYSKRRQMKHWLGKQNYAFSMILSLYMAPLQEKHAVSKGKETFIKHLFAQSLSFEEGAERSVLYVCTLRFQFAMVV